MADESLEQWVARGEALGADETQHQWRVGDWWLAGNAWSRERTALVFGDDWQGPSYQTIRNCARIAARFELYRRRYNLSFAHHVEVASLSAAEADRLLVWCEEPIAAGGKPRSCRELREHMDKIQRTEAERIAKTLDVQPVPARGRASVALEITDAAPAPKVIAVAVTSAQPTAPPAGMIERSAEIVPFARPKLTDSETFYAVIEAAEQSFAAGDYRAAQLQLKGALLIVERQLQEAADERGA